MSIVVAVKKGNELILAADSQASFGSSKPAPGNVTETKIKKVGTALIATTGWGLYGNILNDYLAGKKSVKLSTQQDVFRFFNQFWQALHKQYSFINDQCDEDDSPFRHLDAAFLVVTKKRIFHVSANMSVTEFHKFHAIGSGCDFAIGAMYALYDQDLSATEIACKAAEAAIAHNIYCGGEITIFTP